MVLGSEAASMTSFLWYVLRRWFPLRATRWEARWFQRSLRGVKGTRSTN